MALVPAILSSKVLEIYYLAPSGAVRLSDCTALPASTIPEEGSFGLDINSQLGRAVDSEVWTISGDGLPQPQPFKLLVSLPFYDTTAQTRTAVQALRIAASATRSIWLPTVQQFVLGTSRLGLDPLGEVYKRDASGLIAFRLQGINTIAATFTPSTPYWSDFSSAQQFVF